MRANLKQRRKNEQLSEYNADAHSSLADEIFRKNELNRDRKNLVFFPASHPNIVVNNMDVNTKLWTVGIALFVLMSVILLSLYMGVYGNNEMYCVDLDGEKTCHSDNKNAYRYYGTKTAYHIAAPNSSDDNFLFGGCAPTLFYMLCRHAARYPDKEVIEEMLEELPAIKNKIIISFEDGNSSLCSEDIERFKVWSLGMIPEFDNKVPELARKKTAALAKRFKKRIPNILEHNYSPNRFTFEHTSRERTKTTAEAFAEGLFGKLRVQYIQGKVNDGVLQFNKECGKIRKSCNDTKNIPEVTLFKNGPFVKTMLRSISKRLGFSVSYDEVRTMSKACAFEYALEQDDIWCSLFTRDELKILEYEDDIDDYYADAYGEEINYKQACPVAKYMYDLFNSTKIENMNDVKAVLHFTHAGAIKKVYAMLGLYKDEKPLKADGFCKRQDRKWRSSFIAPFNSNIAIVLLQCGATQRRIAVYHNEQPVIIRGCHDFFCPLEDFFAEYKSVAENCDMNRVCCTCCKS